MDYPPLRMANLSRFLNRQSLGVVGTAAIQIAATGMAFLFSIVLSRVVGVAGVGLYFIVITIIDIGATLSRLGLERSGLRFASIAYNQGDRKELAALYRKCVVLAFAMGVAIVLPAWFILPLLQLGGDSAHELKTNLPLAMFAFAPAAIVVVQAEFLKGVGAPEVGTLVQAVVPQFILLSGGILLWGLGGASVHDMLLLYVAAVIFSALFAAAVWNWRFPETWRVKGYFSTELLITTSLPLFLVASMDLVMGWTDILVLGIWSTPTEVAIYGISQRISALTSFVLVAISSVVAPQFAALYAQGKHAALARLAQHSAFWALAVTAPVILVLLVFPELILGIFGASFEKGALPLRILAVGQLINVATGLVGALLIMTGHQKYIRNNIMVCAMLNLAGNLILVPRYGAVGAAASTAFSLGFMNVISWLLVLKKLRVNTLGYIFTGIRP
jgi:O-antigen/teichoic acid export membrane protein